MRFLTQGKRKQKKILVYLVFLLDMVNELLTLPLLIIIEIYHYCIKH